MTNVVGYHFGGNRTLLAEGITRYVASYAISVVTRDSVFAFQSDDAVRDSIDRQRRCSIREKQSKQPIRTKWLGKLARRLSRPIGTERALRGFSVPPRILWGLLVQMLGPLRALAREDERAGVRGSVFAKVGKAIARRLRRRKGLPPSRHVLCIGEAHGRWQVTRMERTAAHTTGDGGRIPIEE